MSKPSFRAGLGIIICSLALSACASQSVSSPTPTNGTQPSSGATAPATATAAPASPVSTRHTVGTPPGLTVGSPAQAAALVFTTNPLFAQIIPAAPGALGHNTFYTANAARGVFVVQVVIGSGDCQSGCTTTHTWNYQVNPNGQVGLLSQSGPTVETTPPTPSGESAQVTITLVAGPVCPVEQNPPASGCAPRPVAGAQVVVNDTTGAQVTTATSDASGTVTLSLPTGAYYVVASPANGLETAPDPQAFSIVNGSTVGFVMAYDTGIR